MADFGRLDQAPYAGRMAPLMGAAASLTRKATTSAIASGATACASTSLGNAARFARRVKELRRDAVDPNPERAQLEVEDAGQVNEGRLAHRVGRHADRRLDSWSGGDVHDGT